MSAGGERSGDARGPAGPDAADRAARVARAVLAAIAQSPRPAGSDAEAAARAHCAARLAAHGFAVRERPFAYSALPGRWGTPLGGAVLLGALAAAGHAGYRWERPALALAVLALAVLVLALGGGWLARRGVLALPALRARSVNLEATRGGGAPRVWLVAHLDSKSQPVPMAVRVAGIVAAVVATLGAGAVAVAQLAGVAAASAWWPAVTIAGVLGALPVVATTVGARSPGALDDASGVATVLAAVAALPADVPLGVLLPSAEELGLAGARAWAAARAAAGEAPAIALNVDGVDDAGTLVAMWSRRDGSVAALCAALAAAAREAGVAWGDRRLVPGILTDHVALADAGWATLTLSRGTWRTLSRIHTPRDTLAALDGRGAGEAALVLAGAVLRLAADGGTPANRDAPAARLADR